MKLLPDTADGIHEVHFVSSWKHGGKMLEPAGICVSSLSALFKVDQSDVFNMGRALLTTYCSRASYWTTPVRDVSQSLTKVGPNSVRSRDGFEMGSVQLLQVRKCPVLATVGSIPWPRALSVWSLRVPPVSVRVLSRYLSLLAWPKKQRARGNCGNSL